MLHYQCSKRYSLRLLLHYLSVFYPKLLCTFIHLCCFSLKALLSFCSARVSMKKRKGKSCPSYVHPHPQEGFSWLGTLQNGQWTLD